jgi:hypothetical protein
LADNLPHWLSITLAVICWLFALQQIRMALIYLGLIPHPILPQGSHLAKIALRSAINITTYGFIVLLIPWPKLLTYFFGVIVCLTIVDAILGLFGLGVFGDMIENRFYLKSRTIYFMSKIVVVGLITWLCFHFFGF